MEQDGIFAREIAADHEPRPAAIVGAAGFLGSALAQNLGAGGIPVAEFTRTTPFLTVSGTPAAGLLEAHTVFWLASNINPAIAEAKPQRVREDFATFVSMLRIFEQLAEPPRIVLLSSGGAVYDPTVAPPHSENSPVNPRSAYGRAKLELERLMHCSGLNPGNAVAVRVSNAYGPGQPAVSGQGVISYWMRALAAGEPITILGNPATTRDFVYIDDIAEALVAVHCHRGPLPAALNIGAGVPTSSRSSLTWCARWLAPTAKSGTNRPADLMRRTRGWMCAWLPTCWPGSPEPRCESGSPPPGIGFVEIRAAGSDWVWRRFSADRRLSRRHCLVSLA